MTTPSRAEQRGKRTRRGAGCRIAHIGQRIHRFGKAALRIEHGRDDDDDAHQHDDALNEIIDRCGHIPAGDHIDAGKQRHDHDTYGVIYRKGHGKKPGKTII